MIYGPYTQKEMDRITTILTQHSVQFEVVVDAELNEKFRAQVSSHTMRVRTNYSIGHTHSLRIEADQWSRIPGVAQADLAEFNVIPEITDIPEGVELNGEYIPPIKNSANKWSALAVGAVALVYLYVLVKEHWPHFLE